MPPAVAAARARSRARACSQLLPVVAIALLGALVYGLFAALAILLG